MKNIIKILGVKGNDLDEKVENLKRLFTPSDYKYHSKAIDFIIESAYNKYDNLYNFVIESLKNPVVDKNIVKLDDLYPVIPFMTFAYDSYIDRVFKDDRVFNLSVNVLDVLHARKLIYLTLKTNINLLIQKYLYNYIKDMPLNDAFEVLEIIPLTTLSNRVLIRLFPVLVIKNEPIEDEYDRILTMHAENLDLNDNNVKMLSQIIKDTSESMGIELSEEDVLKKIVEILDLIQEDEYEINSP